MPPREVLAAFPWASLSWLLVNEGEAGDLLEVLGEKAAGDGAEGLLKGLQDVDALKNVGLVITCGPAGVVAASNSHLVRSPAGAVHGKVTDTTGAGDCFTGFFATLLAQTVPSGAEGPSAEQLESVLAVACQAAAMCVEAEGAMESVPVIGEVRERMGARWPNGEAWEALGK